MVLTSNQFFSLLCVLIFLVIFIAWNNSFKDVYGHGLSRDQSLPFNVSGKQIAIEGIMEPPFLNEDNIKPTLTIRTFDEKTNETIKDLNYRLIAKFKNETILDQQFHSSDGYIKADLISSNSSNIHELINPNKEKQISKNDLAEVSSIQPITLMSKIFTDGGLYELSVFLEKSRNLDIAQWNTVVPFVFKTENINHAALHRKKLLDLGHISINPKFSNLIMALRGAVFNEFKLDKDESVNEGLMDTYLMLTGGVTFFKFKSPSDY